MKRCGQRLSLRLLVPTIVAVSVLGVASCFLDNPEAAQPALDAQAEGAAASDAEGADAVVDAAAKAAAEAGPPLCTKYGGYSTIEKVVADLVGALVDDCRISRFFTVLDATRQAHLSDCLVKQVAVVTGCPGIAYDVDNAGVECRDMVVSHKGLSIRGADFDALLQDLVTVLLKAGVTQADVDVLAPSLLRLRGDIVTNSAPSHGKAICDAGGDQ